VRLTALEPACRTAAVAAVLHALVFTTGAEGTYTDTSGAGLRVTKRISIGGATAFAADGAQLWVARAGDLRKPGEIVRVRVSSGKRRHWAAIGSSPQAVAVGYGSVWAVASSLDAESNAGVFRIGTVRPSTQVFGIPSPNRVVIGFHRVWILSVAGRLLFEINPQTDRVVRRFRLVGGLPVDVARSARSLWVSFDTADGKSAVRELDPESGVFKRRIVAPESLHQLSARGSTVCGAGQQGVYCWQGANLIRRGLRIKNPSNVSVGRRGVWVTGGPPGSVRFSRFPFRRLRRVAIGRSADQISVSRRGAWIADSIGRRLVFVSES
jgi:hypothetical protein